MLDKVDVLELLKVLVKRWWVVFICMLVAGSTAYGYSRFVQEKQYVSVGRMYIDTYRHENTDGEDGTKVQRNLSVINASQRSVLTCIEVLKSTRVLNQVAEKCDLGYSASRIKGMLTLSSANDTEILEVRATCPNYKHTKVIVDTLMEVGTYELKEIVGVSNVNIIDQGTASKKEAPISPNVKLQTIVGAFIGTMIGIIIIIAITLMDKRIKSEEDLQQYNIPVIGVIPEMF